MSRRLPRGHRVPGARTPASGPRFEAENVRNSERRVEGRAKEQEGARGAFPLRSRRLGRAGRQARCLTCLGGGCCASPTAGLRAASQLRANAESTPGPASHDPGAEARPPPWHHPRRHRRGDLTQGGGSRARDAGARPPLLVNDLECRQS